MRSEREVIEKMQSIEELLPGKSIMATKVLCGQQEILHWFLEKRDNHPKTDDLLKDILFEIRKITKEHTNE